MEMIKVAEYDIINYLICTYLLRNRKVSAVIHCSSEKVLGELGVYMASIGMLWSKDDTPIKGYYLTTKMDMDKEEGFHIFITFNKESSWLKGIEKEGLIFLIENKDQEAIEGSIRDFSTFDLSEVPIHLKNEEIRRMFIRAFIIAEKEIDIISPWMNFTVVNESLIDLMEKAIKRGVKIRIIYGLLPGSDEYNLNRSRKSDAVAEKLRERLDKYGDYIKIKRDNIHYKLVLCDEKFKLEGGYNYLSFTGDYSDESTRKEGSPFGRDIKEIQHLRKEYFDNDKI